MTRGTGFWELFWKREVFFGRFGFHFMWLESGVLGLLVCFVSVVSVYCTILVKRVVDERLLESVSTDLRAAKEKKRE